MMAILRPHRHLGFGRTNAKPSPGSAELGLLLCLARANLGPDQERRMEGFLTGPLDWDGFLRLAERHRLMPLCARHLNRLAADRVPPATLLLMRSYAEQNVERSLRLTGELRTLLRLFETAGIPAVAFKGPVLAQDLYGSIALRDMLDLDILVAKQDALRARDMLLERGYRSAVPTGERWDSYFLWSGCNFPLLHDATGFVVELHWTPEACLPPQDVAELWQRLEYVSLAGMQVPTFARQDLLLLLCLHGCRHMWERLEWLAGVAELLRRIDVAWDDVLRLASSLGARRALLLGVTLAHHFLEAPVPADILRQARADPRTDRLVDAACGQLFSETPVLAHQLGFPFHDFQLCSRERLRDRFMYVLKRFTAPSLEAWENWRLPWSLFRVHCAVRRLRLVAAYGGWLWRRRTPIGFANTADAGGKR
jgi:hypothetical protein